MEGRINGARAQILTQDSYHRRQSLSAEDLRGRKYSDASTSSNSSSRKMSNDSGISTNGNPDLIGEPRIAMFHQNAAAAAAAMFNMQASTANPFLPSSAVGLSSLWSNPLTAATFMHQQQEAARKVLESASGKSSVRPFKQYPNPKDSMAMPGWCSAFLPTGLPPSADSSSLVDPMKIQEQMLLAYKQMMCQSGVNPEPAPAFDSVKKPTRKSHSFSGGSSPLAAATNVNTNRLSPSVDRSHTEDRTNSSYQDEDDRQSIGSCHSSTHSFDMKSTVSAPVVPIPRHADGSPVEGAAHSRKESTRRRKLGVIGFTSSDLTEDEKISHTSSASQIPTHKLSTASLPANLPSSGRLGSRKRPRPLPDDEKDDLYWERRRKNNEAAKRSRDSRRAKEDEIAIRAAFLEQENLRLRMEMATMNQELTKLKNELTAAQSRKAEKQKNNPELSPPESPDKAS